MNTAANRVQAFLDLWAERRDKGGQYTETIYSLGTHDDSVDLTDSDIREAFAEIWDEGAEDRARHLLSLGEIESENPYRTKEQP